MKKVYIVSAKRSPIASFLGDFNKLNIDSLGIQVIEDLIKTANMKKDVIDQLILGNVLQAGSRQNLAKTLATKTNLNPNCISYTVNMVCGSGLQAINLAMDAINLGKADVIIAGGIEHMSKAPFLVDAKIRSGVHKENQVMVDSIIQDGLTDGVLNQHMGEITEELNNLFDIPLAQQNQFAINSINKFKVAQQNGAFINEITPIKLDNGQLINQDQFSKITFTESKINTLRTPFKKEGTINAANASNYADAASFVLLLSEEALKKYQLTPLAEVVSIVTVGIDALLMGLAPVEAITKNLKTANLSFNDLSAIHINEAFALQMLAVVKKLSQHLNITESSILAKLNQNGGALAYGHPIGASSNIMVSSLCHQLKNNQYGLASVCIGGGMGMSIIVRGLL